MKNILLCVFAIISISTKAQLIKLYDMPNNTAGGYSSLTYSSGLLYGTTASGGANYGGFIYTITTSGTEFTNIFDFPSSYTRACGSVIIDSNIIYGMASQGGNTGLGSIYKINTDGSGNTILHQFTGNTDGRTPQGSLTLSGNVLYGMTRMGGENCGTIFSINTDGTNFTTLYTFNPSANSPYGSLILDNGVLYGMASGRGCAGFGTIFSINTDGSNFTILHTFNGVDGKWPNGSLTIDGNVLYGMSALGGGGEFPRGNIFKINKDGTGFQVVFASLNGSQYYTWPYGSLTLVGNVLYGKTNRNLYSINTDGTGYQWYNLNSWGPAQGSYDIEENGNLTYDGSVLYGVNNRLGGLYEDGIIFKLTPSTTSTNNSYFADYEEINLFPNPSNGKFTVNRGKQNNLNGFNVKVGNIFGQIIYDSNTNQDSLSIDLYDKIYKGIYFVYISDGKGNTIEIKKIVIQ